jgi:hypothetical protein
VGVHQRFLGFCFIFDEDLYLCERRGYLIIWYMCWKEICCSQEIDSWSGDRRKVVCFWWIRCTFYLKNWWYGEEWWVNVEKRDFGYLSKGQVLTRVVYSTWKLLFGRFPIKMNIDIHNTIPAHESVKSVEFGYTVVRFYVYYSSEFICSLGMLV